MIYRPQRMPGGDLGGVKWQGEGNCSCCRNRWHVKPILLGFLVVDLSVARDKQMECGELKHI